MERTLSRHLALLAAGIASAILGPRALAQTPPCGTVLTQSIRLNADMYCPATQPALIVGADNVHIELGGFNIVGQGATNPLMLSATAIVSHGRNGVEVVGPGQVTGFLYDVLIAGGRSHVVAGITSGSLGGIGLWGASDSTIKDNDLAYGVSIKGDLGPPTYTPTPAFGNEILGNRIGTATPRQGFVYMEGCFAQKNTVASNEIYGKVWIDYGGNANVIQGNRISCSSLWSNIAVHLREAARNEILGNVVDADGGTGISIDSSGAPLCGNIGSGRNGDGNRVYANYIRNGSTGARVVTAWGQPAGYVTIGNVILGNTFVDMTVNGQEFGPGTANNDGRNNKYWNVPIEVEDFGTGNLWP